MDRVSLFMRLSWIVALVVLFAGCASGGAKKGEAEYEGEFRDFDLFLHPLTSNGVTGGWNLYPGANVDVWAFSLDDTNRAKATVPGPTIRVREGDTVRITFYLGSTPMAHTLHWHGIHVPWDQDGVPYMSQNPIGETRFGGNGSKFVTYEFKVTQSGTYWYHCHVDTAHHLDMGMYGALIVDPKNPKQDPPYTNEATLVLDEWDRNHAHSNQDALKSALSKSGDPKTSANDFYAILRDYLVMQPQYDDLAKANNNLLPIIREQRSWYPVTYAPYIAEYDTYLINGHAFPYTEPIFVKTGDVLRLRIVNAGEQVHALHLHGHHMYVTHTDGYVVPLLRQLRDASGVTTEGEMQFYAEARDTILIAPGQRYDAYVYAENPGPWHIHDHISLNEENDHIAPGGMATMICYTDGWPNAEETCRKGHELHNRGETVTAGDLFNWQYLELLKNDPSGRVQPGTGVSVAPEATTTPIDSSQAAGSTAPVSTGGVSIPPISHDH